MTFLKPPTREELIEKKTSDMFTLLHRPDFANFSFRENHLTEEETIEVLKNLHQRLVEHLLAQKEMNKQQKEYHAQEEERLIQALQTL